MPERPYTQTNRYKERSYPMLKLMKDLHQKNQLTPAQALFMAPRKPDEELYDIIKDPWEIHNLAQQPKHQSTLKKFRAALKTWITQTGDQGQFPEQISSITSRDRQRIRGDNTYPTTVIR